MASTTAPRIVLLVVGALSLVGAVAFAEIDTPAQALRSGGTVLVGWGLVALFIWFAENIGTFARAWTYPSQKDGWHMVGVEKLGSWYLLMIISFVLVSIVQRPKTPDNAG